MTPSVSPVTAYIALGANLGDASATVCQALLDLGRLPHSTLVQASSLYRSAPIASSGPDYINAVAELRTALPAFSLLQALQRLEDAAGRERPYPNAPRTLDLDLLLYGELRQDDPVLTLPHPRMDVRAFVLHPLAEIAPQRVTAAQLAAVRDQPIERLPAAAR